MSSRPHVLPEKRNEMLEEPRAPDHSILIERRCLGQTELKVKPGQIGTSNATKLENLGFLDYAHLRVPLPRDLTGSGIFQRGSNRKWPDAYFLMRRSSDGFISATGMFKAAFPYASAEDETNEKEYIKSLPAASSEEVAGNVWIDPSKALDLAEEYGIRLWIAALLDPEPITHGTSDPKKSIRSPPPFIMEEDSANGVSKTPPKSAAKPGRGSRRARSMRSESPSKAAATPRKIATPRRPRKTRGATASVDETASIKEDVEAEMNGDHKVETVKVEVETVTQPDANGVEQVESTKVNVTMPSNHPDLKIPDNAEDMMATARKMVQDAEKIGGPSTRKGKRKAEEMVEADDEVGLDGPSKPGKRARPVEVELRKEKIRRRALTGIAASLVVGALIPTVMSWL
ncbi:hypothetical protein AC578_4090 [Pseudocercospora eumusae]|uniref:HTH APSES-type domain-containing protein n=1 Tax=Pseudocercospora eumusae TaxID=321146 RepID=A0A139HDN4_9PEZI|nr:hypothetical protein AC578_4090 [Pseudocercospora eumusae]